MNPRPILIALLLLLPLTATAANPRSIALTIHDSGRAQISETHDLPPPAADGSLKVAPLPETILPASVNAAPLTRETTFDILSQRYAYDLRDADALFRVFFGQTLTAHIGAETSTGRLAVLPDFTTPAPRLVLTGSDQRLHVFPDINRLDSVQFPPAPHLERSPALHWQIPAGQPPPPAVQLNYSADGFAWSAVHEGILAPKGGTISLISRVHLANRTVREFANARVRLALSDKGRFAPLVPAASDPRAGHAPALRPAADGVTWIPERAAASMATIATYDLPQPLTLPPAADIYANLAFIESIPVETGYLYDGVRFDRYQRNRRTDSYLGTEFSRVIETRLTFKLPAGASLPPGPFQLMRGDANQALEHVGSDWLPPLAPGDVAALNLGPAPGLSGRRLRTAFTEVASFKGLEETFEITLYNQTDADQAITVIEHLYRGGNYEILAASAEHTPGLIPNSIRFTLPVKAGSSKTLTYTVRYTW